MSIYLNIGILGCLLALASCQGTPVVEQAVSGHTSLKGKAVWGIEAVEIVLCNTARHNCDFPKPDEQQRVCALTFSEEGWESLQSYRYKQDEYGAPVGEVWLEGAGVKSSEKGSYGHVGAYSCEVRFDKVTDLDRGPPWFYEPPPAR